MKTRIIYPKNVWYNREFNALTTTNKLLCLYFITNENIGMTRVYKQNDMETRFIHSLSQAQLDKCKEEIEATGLFLFYDEWIYINNDFSYCDYDGRDRVLNAKEKEILSIPSQVLTHFEGVVKGLKSGYKPPINHKPKTINPKSKTLNPKTVDEEFLKELAVKFPEVDVKYEWEKAQDWLASSGKQKRDMQAFLRNWVRRSFEDKSVRSGRKAGGVYVE